MSGGQTTRSDDDPRDPAIGAALRGLARSGRLAWIGVLVVFSIAMVQLPLFGVLGFELAVASTVLGSIVSLDLGIGLARRAARVPAPALARARDPGRTVAALAATAAGVAIAVTAIPALFAAVHGLWAPTCDWLFGVRAYVSLVSTGAAIFAGAGVAIGLATAGARPWVPAVTAVGLVLAIAAVGLWRFYSEPPVFTYSSLVGYFPGNLYDENIKLDAPLYWSRLEELAWVVAALAALAIVVDAPTLRPRWRERRPAAPRWRDAAVAAGALAIASVVHLASGDLGYAVDADDIQEVLSGRIETEHFVIHYAETDEIVRDIDLIAEDHEFRLAQVADALGLDDEHLARLGRLRSYYFASSSQKSRLMGAEGVEMAKPWRKEIYLTHGELPVRALRHEIAHAVASSFGDPWFGVAAGRVAGLPLEFNPGLIEGLAVAIDWPSGAYEVALTPHQSVRAMQEMGLQPSVFRVMSLGFLAQSSARSYTTAGSFVRYLLDRDGPRALRTLYATGGDFERAYGLDLGTLEAEWRAMTMAIPLSDDEIEKVRERFRRTSVFQRPCPHAVAAAASKAVQARQRGDRHGAISLLRRVCEDSGQEPRYRLALARMLVGVGAPDVEDAERVEGLAMLDALATDEVLTSTVRADALVARADHDARIGDWAAVEAHLAEAAELPLDDDRARQLEAHLLAVRHRGPAGDALRAYFYAVPDPELPLEELLGFRGETAGRAIAAEPWLGIGWYLRGLQRAFGDDPAGAVSDLRTALALPLPSPRFVRKGAREMAVAAWRARDRAAILEAAALLDQPTHSEVDRLLAADWRARAAFAGRRAATSR